MPLQNSCSEVALIKGFEKILGIALHFDEDHYNNDFQIGLEPLLKIIPGDDKVFNTDEKSGKSMAALQAVFDDLDQGSVYLLRTGTMGGAGHFQAVYFDEGWHVATSSRLPPTPATDADGIVLPQIKDRLVTEYANWGVESDEYAFQFYSLNRERLIAGANFIAGCRQFEGEEFEVDALSNAFPAQLIETSGDYFLDIAPESQDYWRLDKPIPPLTEREQTITCLAILQYQVCIQGRVEALDQMIRYGFDLNETIENETLLHWAVKKNNAKIAQVLMQQGVDINVRNDNGATPSDLLDEMSKTVPESELRTLKGIFQSRAIADAGDISAEEAQQFLISACELNNMDGIKLSIKKGADAGINNADKKTPLDVLLEMAINSNLSWSDIEDSILILMENLLENDDALAVDALDKLLAIRLKNKPFPINNRYFWGAGCDLELLTLASNRRFPDNLGQVPTLIKHGADYHIYGRKANGQWGFTRLEFDARERQVVDHLALYRLDKKLPIDSSLAEIYKSINFSRGHYYGTTLLHVAAKADCQYFIRKLIANGADVGIPDETGQTPDQMLQQDDEEDVVDRADAVDELMDKLDDYLNCRNEGLQVPREKYFWGGLFGGGISYTRKLAAVTALRNALTWDPSEGAPEDLSPHLAALRDGDLGAMLRQFIRGSYWQPSVQATAQSIVGDEVLARPRVRDFITALTAYNGHVYDQYLQNNP